MHIDLVETIHEQIMSFRKGRKSRFYLSLMLDNEDVEAPSSGLTFKITERPFPAMDSSDDTEFGTADDASISVATEITASGLHEWKVSICKF